MRRFWKKHEHTAKIRRKAARHVRNVLFNTAKRYRQKRLHEAQQQYEVSYCCDANKNLPAARVSY